MQQTTTKQKTLEKRKVKKAQKQASVTIKAVKKIFHIIHPTAKKIKKTMTRKEEKVLLHKTKRYLQRKIFPQVSQRNILVTIKEQITLRYQEIRNP